MAEKKKILIVDDEQSILKAISDYFVEEGFDVAIAIDGEAGLAKAIEFQPDIILVDIIMPKLDGIGMLKGIRSDPNIKDVPVIILSNLMDSDKVSAAIEAGSTEYLLKINFGLEEVGKKVRQRLGMN